jgi:hypothetical protein
VNSLCLSALVAKKEKHLTTKGHKGLRKGTIGFFKDDYERNIKRISGICQTGRSKLQP